MISRRFSSVVPDYSGALNEIRRHVEKSEKIAVVRLTETEESPRENLSELSGVGWFATPLDKASELFSRLRQEEYSVFWLISERDLPRLYRAFLPEAGPEVRVFVSQDDEGAEYLPGTAGIIDFPRSNLVLTTCRKLKQLLAAT